MLYLKSIKIENIKKIDKLEYVFPEIKFGLENEPIISKGVLLTGSNFIGKTTFLQCLNTALRNDIGNNLKPEDALSKGQHEGIIDLQLIDERGQIHRKIDKFTKDTEKPVEHKWVYSCGHNILKSHNSGAIGKLKKIFNYHYINPNDIISYAQTAKGRRKLMSYFLNSVSDEVRKEYEEWDVKEQAAFEVRTQKNVSRASCKTIRDNLELSPEDLLVLKSLEPLNEQLESLNTTRDKVLQDIGSYENIYNQIYFASSVTDEELYWDTCIIGKLQHYRKKKESKSVERDELKKELNIKIQENTELEGKFNPIIEALKSGLTTATINTYSETLQLIKDKYKALSELNTGVSDEVTQLNNRITNCDSDIIDYVNKIVQLEGEEIELKAKLPEIKPSTENVDNQIKLKQEQIDEVNIIVKKQQDYNKAVDNAINADLEWEIENDKVIEARDNKKRIIEDNNIEVEGFEFSPDGVTLKGFDFAEINISGAERRIAAAQFTMAMNSTVGLTILEEMESLDEEQEQHMLKFAADRGYVVVSDNVVKQKVDDIIIKNVTIK